MIFTTLTGALLPNIITRPMPIAATALVILSNLVLYPTKNISGEGLNYKFN